MPLLARISVPARTADRRRAVRRTLRLDAPLDRNESAGQTVVVRNLSRTGLMIETATNLAVGESFILHLPEIGPTPARVRWRDAAACGCEFISPVSAAALSAALLKGEVEPSAEAVLARANGDRVWRGRGRQIALAALAATLVAAALYLANNMG